MSSATATAYSLLPALDLPWMSWLTPQCRLSKSYLLNTGTVAMLTSISRKAPQNDKPSSSIRARMNDRLMVFMLQMVTAGKWISASGTVFESSEVVTSECTNSTTSRYTKYTVHTEATLGIA